MSTEHTTADDSTETGWAQVGLTLHRGWSVGKKVAIAGAAITVAPVVVPPLLVFSAFGLALSVPFGIYYAGMVGTERLMQSLLPLGQGQEIREGNGEEFEIVEGKGYIDERDFKPEKNVEKKGDDVMVETLFEIVEEGEGNVGKRDYKTGEKGQREYDDSIVEIPSERDALPRERAEMKKYDEIVKTLDEKDEMVRKSDAKEGVAGVEELGGTKKEDAKGDTDSNKVVVERLIDGSNAKVDKGFINIEIKPKEVTSTTLNEDGTERLRAEVVQVETGNTVVMEGKQTVIADRNVAKKGDNDLGAASSKDVDVSEVDGKSDLALDSASTESPVTSDGEEFYTKKQLWDQLRALRTIVGYKATISKTLPDELRALYVFTGVELPSTASDASNLLDLNHKVKFLKSVIGVK